MQFYYFSIFILLIIIIIIIIVIIIIFFPLHLIVFCKFILKKVKRPRGRPYSNDLRLSRLEVTKALTKIFVCSVDKKFLIQ